MTGPDSELLQQLLDRRPDEEVLITGAAIISMDPEIGDLPSGDILIRGSYIEAIGADLAHAAADGQRIVVDAEGAIAVPGLQDTHRHSWQTQMRRMLVDGSFGEYVELMHLQLGPLYSPEDIYLGTHLAAMTALDQGITTVLDYSHNRRTEAHADQAVAAWRDAGARTVFVPVAPLAGEWDGRWREDLVRLRENAFASDDGLIRLRAGVYTRAVPELVVGDLALTAETATFARELELGITCDAVFGPHSSAHLEALAAEGGVLGPDVTFIHCQSISTASWRAIADNGCHVALAATSDAQLGCEEAVPPIQQALDLGITPGLSIDVECCLSSDMFTQMQVVLNVQRMLAAQRHHHGDASAPSPIACRDALHYATIAGARANGVDDVAGSLTPGKQADIVLIRGDDINNLPLNDAIGTVVLGTGAHNVERVLVAGRPRKWARALVGCDVAALRERVVASRDHLLAQVGRDLAVAS